MSDAYRATSNSCPGCATPLREFNKRLVCDQCGGMLLATDDFLRACGEVAGTMLSVAYRDEEPAKQTCPRCSISLTSCKLSLAGKNVKPTVLRCTEHGLWCDADALQRVFAVLRRSFSPLGGYSSGAPSRTGLDGLPVPQNRPASSRLAISSWHEKSRKREPREAPVDTYRDLDLACPACPPTTEQLRFAGDRWTCSGCHGAFVQKAAIEALIEEMSSAPYELVPPSGSAGPRACPVCRELMVQETLGSPVVDRCATHGVWFDQHELQTALVDLGVPESGGVVGWLKRVFA